MQRVYLPSGIVPIAAPVGFRLGSESTVTSASSTYTPPATCRWLVIVCVGQGGTGPATGNATAAQIILSGGGGSGGMSITQMAADVSKNAGFTCTIGATTLVTLAASGASICLANQGLNGTTLATGTAEAFIVGGNGGSLSGVIGDITLQGNQGGIGHRVSGTVGCSGDGAHGPWGGGGQGRLTQGVGGSGGNYGAGGAGNLSINAGGTTVASTRGPGAIFFWEYY